MPSVASALVANLGKWKGSMTALNAVPPVILPFTFAPEEIEDEFNPQFEITNQPGSRYSYPMFKNMGARTLRFKLRFDSSHPIADPVLDYEYISDQFKGRSNTLKTEIIYSSNVEVPLAIIEKMKISRQGIMATLINAIGTFTVVSSSHPGPPLILLSLNMFKWYVGFLSSATIRRIRFTQHMLCTRAEIDCEFLVSPDYIFTTVEDALREVYSLWGYIK